MVKVAEQATAVRRTIAFAGLAVAAAIFCGVPLRERKGDIGGMRRPEAMIIYNVFPLLAGKFTEWEKHLVRASEMGFNWIFVNPIQRPGKSGSIYGVADYYDYNPLLIDQQSNLKPQEQVKAVIKTAERLGLKAMVDLVINHCSVDSDLLRLHPDWFLWEAEGRVAHPSADENGKNVVWMDLAQFDHKNTRAQNALFQYFLGVVESLMELGFKAFRCDAAYQLPRNLWERLIHETKRMHPDVLFVAETLGCQPDQTRNTASAGFDYIFNSSKWWDFNSPWLMQQYALTREIAPSIAFPESHDTVRLCEELNGNIAGLKQRYLFSALFSAAVMIPIGFEFGFRKELHVAKTRPEDWEQTNIDLISFITRVNKIKAEHIIFQEDPPTQIRQYGDNQNILLIWKASTSCREESLIILNTDIHNRQHFHAEPMKQFMQSGAPLMDISPECPLEYIPVPFSYDLQPGQGIVLITTRDSFPERGHGPDGFSG